MQDVAEAILQQTSRSNGVAMLMTMAETFVDTTRAYRILRTPVTAYRVEQCLYRRHYDSSDDEHDDESWHHTDLRDGEWGTLATFSDVAVAMEFLRVLCHRSPPRPRGLHFYVGDDKGGWRYAALVKDDAAACRFLVHVL